ncbi:transposase [Rhodococcus opacus]|uniref:transposase n=1 Tax=Rhodococcus opacus TaxID=37919 RepID=UPI00211E4755|nr:transposase [Rhodococcus opacus]
MRWRIRAGTPCRDVPARYGPWQTVYWLFRRWQRAGVWVGNRQSDSLVAPAQGENRVVKLFAYWFIGTCPVYVEALRRGAEVCAQWLCARTATA